MCTQREIDEDTSESLWNNGITRLVYFGAKLLSPCGFFHNACLELFKVPSEK